jgi:hypothetical protein
MSVAALPTYVICRKPGCGDPAYLHGWCLKHGDGWWTAEGDVLTWPTESEAEKCRRQRALDAIDKLLDDVEMFNLYRGSEFSPPVRLISRYRLLGGVRTWAGVWPTGGDLHAALLGLEESFVRLPRTEYLSPSGR